MGTTTVSMASDGAVTAVRHPHRDHSMLLAEGAPNGEGSMHDAAHRWGKGFAILDGRGYRFDAPAQVEWRDDGVVLTYPLGPLSLTVHRQVRRTWSESYELANPSAASVDIGSFAISTPWRDVYGSARGQPAAGGARARLDGGCRRLGVGGADGRQRAGTGPQT